MINRQKRKKKQFFRKFSVCGVRYKTRPGLTYHYSHSHKEGASDENSRESASAPPANSPVQATVQAAVPPVTVATAQGNATAGGAQVEGLNIVPPHGVPPQIVPPHGVPLGVHGVAPPLHGGSAGVPPHHGAPPGVPPHGVPSHGVAPPPLPPNATMGHAPMPHGRGYPGAPPHLQGQAYQDNYVNFLNHPAANPGTCHIFYLIYI